MIFKVILSSSYKKFVSKCSSRYSFNIAKAQNPDWRYCAGADAEKLFEAKRQMGAIKFERFLDELFGS